MNTVPAWHPALLVGLILLVSAVGLAFSGQARDVAGTRASLVARAYVPFLLVSWGLLLYVCRVGRPRSAFADLVGVGWHSPWRALGDIALACCAAAVLIGGEFVWARLFGSLRNAAAEALLPGTPLERAAWCAVAVSAGVSEEIVYRGYLAKELARWTSSRVVGLGGQALLFALAHGEQGAGAMLRFFIYALALGCLAAARRSLVPGILAHVGVDLIAGFAR